MALIKEKILDNGVITNYHRIVSINTITNIQSIIEVASYTSKEKRLEEIEAIRDNLPMNVFINTSYYNIDYDKDMNVDNAYEYLKTLEDFTDSEDDE